MVAPDSRDYSTEAGVPASTLNARNKIMATARDSRDYSTEAGVQAWTLNAQNKIMATALLWI